MKVRSSFPLARSQSFSVSVPTPRERGSAVRGNGDAGHLTGVPGEGAQLFSAGQVPELQRLVRDSPRARFGRPGQWRRWSPAGVPGEGAQLFSAGQVPELQRLVLATRERGSAVRGNGDAGHRIGVAREDAQLFPVAKVPEPERLIVAPGEGSSAVRGNGNAGHVSGVPGEGAQLFSAGEVPELQRLVLTLQRAPFDRPAQWQRSARNRSAPRRCAALFR